MKRSVFAGLTLTGLLSASAYAGDWRVGPGVNVVTGLDDITDLYEKNFNNTNTYIKADVKTLIPVGLSVQGTYNWDSGVRLDMGLGPVFLLLDDSSDDIDTDLEYTDVPVSASVGYNFIRAGQVSPYLRAGLAHHFASGTYVEGSSPGLVAAAGVEFKRQSTVMFALEVSVDKSKVEFERFSTTRRRDTVELSPYDFVVTFLAKF